MKALLIPADPASAVTTIELSSDHRELEQLREAVGGDIQMLCWPGRNDVVCCCNEVGKNKNLPRNARATRIFQPVIRERDWIAGTLVVTGFDQVTGQTLAIPDGLMEWVAQRLMIKPLGEPDRTVRKAESRRLSFEWLVMTDEDEQGRERQHYAALICVHQPAGINYATMEHHGSRLLAMLQREISSDSPLGEMRSFRFGSALRIVTEDINRYTAKQLEAFAALAVERVRGLHKTGDDRVLRYFDLEAKH